LITKNRNIYFLYRLIGNAQGLPKANFFQRQAYMRLKTTWAFQNGSPGKGGRTILSDSFKHGAPETATMASFGHSPGKSNTSEDKKRCKISPRGT
jgi:hypothetical protein